jgi:filamentous hemagglutinin family protein
MHRSSINHTYRLIWSDVKNAFVAVAENVKGRGKKSRSGRSLAAIVLTASCALFAGESAAQTLPTGGSVVAGSGSISQSSKVLTVNQTTAKMAVDWQTFNIGAGNTVNFVQPSSSSVALNRVLGTDVSVIQGALTANGQVFLLNPNGVMFSPTAQVNVGGIVASTLNLSTADFMAGNYKFAGSSSNAIINQGNITAHGDSSGGTIALIAAKITNDGTLTAQGGNVLLGAGSQVTLDLGGPVKLHVTQGAIDALIQQGGAIKADGGLVYLSAKAAGDLASTVINNTGHIEAQTLSTGEKGQIYLLGGMENDRIVVGGKLDASAPNGGDGGFIETSAAKVSFAKGVNVTTASAKGQTGQWLIDPVDFTVAATGGDISGTALGTLLATNSITIETATAPTATATNLIGSTGTNGDIFVNDTVSWSANTTLTLSAYRNININSAITASGASGKVALLYGQGSAGGGATDAYSFGLSSTGFAGSINLQAGANFSTRLGSSGPLINWTVITALGNSTDNTTSTTNSLQGLAYLGAGNGSSYPNSKLTGNYVLGANINASATSTWNGGFGFTPIGTGVTGYAAGDNAFSGRFDGLGHTISSLTVNRPTPTNANYRGLFGMANGATLRNIGLASASITGIDRTGALIGYSASNSTISNSYVTGSVTGTSSVGGMVGYSAAGVINNSYSTATVTGTVGGIGGLVGNNTGTISSSFATGAVSGSVTAWLGGLTGGNSGTISNSYATGAVSFLTAGAATGKRGGLLASNSGTISNTYATGLISGATGTRGGLVAESTGGSISNSFWDTQTTGQATSAAGTGKTTAEMKDLATFGTWGSTIVGDASLSNVAPQLRWVTSGLAAGTSIWVVGQSSTSVNYTLAPLAGTYTYTGNPYLLTTLWSSPTSIFGGTYSSWVAGTDYSFSATSYTNAGTYSSISVNVLKSGFVAAGSGNTTGSLIIAKAPLSVTANNAAMTYNGSAYAGTPGITYSGFVTPTSGVQETNAVLGGTLAYAYSTASPTNAGNYTITPSGLTASNYTIANNTGTLTIDQRPITVTADAKSKTYGNVDPSLTYAVTTGSLVSGDSLAGAPSRNAGETAGDYAILQGSLNNTNYLIAYNANNLTIGAPTPSVSLLPTLGSAITIAQSLASKPAGRNTVPQQPLMPPEPISSVPGSNAPAVTLSGGLAFMDAPLAIIKTGAPGDQSEAGPGSAGAAPRVAEGGRDASGFMRVFVVSGGISLPSSNQ